MKRLLAALLLATAVACDADTTVPNPTPLPPAGLFTAPHSAGIALTWIDKSADETSFELEFARDTGAYHLIATLAADQTTYTHTDIQPPLYHKYRVRACNAHGCSAYSNESGRSAAYPPAPPSIISVTVTNSIVTQTSVAVFVGTGAAVSHLHIEYAPVGVSFADGARTDTYVLDPFYDAEGYLLPTPHFSTVSVEAGKSYSLRAVVRNGMGSDTSEVLTYTARAAQ